MSSFMKSAWNKVFMVLRFVFPIISCKHGNNILDKKIKSIKHHEIHLTYMTEWDTLTIEEAEGFFNSSVEQKRILESKAQITIVGLTIAVSLIIGLGSSLLGNKALSHSPLQLWVIVFGIISLVYFIMAGCMSFEVLVERNQVYQLFPKEMRSPDKEKLEKISFNTELNVNLNIIRYNYVYCAYRSILYAVISLGIMFILSAIGVL